MTKRRKWIFWIVAAMLIYKAFMIYIDWGDLSCYITKDAQSIETIKQFLGFRIVWFDIISMLALLTILVILVGQGTVNGTGTGDGSVPRSDGQSDKQ